MTSKTTISSHALAALAVLWCLCIVPGLAAAQSNSAQAALWDTYTDAAAQANEADQFASAAVLWTSAIQLAEQMGPDEARLFFSRQMLLLTYFDLGEGKSAEAQALVPLTQHLDGSTINAGLLPFSRTLDGLASTYDARRKGRESVLALDEAERCRMLQTVIQKKVLTQDVDRARDLAFYGVVLSHQRKFDCTDPKVDCAGQKLQEALSYWDVQDAKTHRRLQANKRFSLLNEGDPVLEEVSEDPIYVKAILANAYYDLGTTPSPPAPPARLRALFSRRNRSTNRIYRPGCKPGLTVPIRP